MSSRSRRASTSRSDRCGTSRTQASSASEVHHGGMEPRPAPGPSPLLLSLALVIPIAGLALVLRNPSLDVHWEHHPAHFWLVSVVALLNVVLGLIVSEVAKRSRDERLFLVSMVLLTSAGFLGLHALATPGVVLAGPNGGFVLATPVGLLLASAFAALSSMELDAHAERRRSLQTPMRVGLISRAARVGGCLARRGSSARPGDRVRASALALGPAPVRYRGVCVRRLAIPAHLSGAPPPATARRGGGVRVARRGAGRNGVRPRVAGVVVGVARAHGARLCHDRARVSARVPA